MKRGGGFWAAAIAAFAFAVFAAVFVCESQSLYRSMVEYARRDLKARTELAAQILEEPLRTQDFKRVREFDDDCRGQGIQLAVLHANGGYVFGGDAPPGWCETEKCGEYRVRLNIDGARMFLPYAGSLFLAGLAFLVGIAGMVFVFFAFYRQRAKLRENERRLADLARLEKERREFIADFSHELKTPLTGIIGAAEMLADGHSAESDPDHALCGMVSTEAKRLNSLAQQILDLSRLEGAGAAMPSAAELVDRAVGQLVENAKRHSGTDDVTVTEATKDGFRRWIVEDHGVGVPPEFRERIFERFFRVDSARAAESGGAGLGLAIVRRIARNLGGDCVCEAAEPHGARFIFSIPEQRQ